MRDGYCCHFEMGRFSSLPHIIVLKPAATDRGMSWSKPFPNRTLTLTP
jgi:hypothetical protein